MLEHKSYNGHSGLPPCCLRMGYRVPSKPHFLLIVIYKMFNGLSIVVSGRIYGIVNVSIMKYIELRVRGTRLH